MTKFCTILTAILLSFSFNNAWAQLSPELAPIEGAKSQTEANTVLVVKNWNQQSPFYNEAIFKYNALRGTFSETINYLNFYYGLSKNKQKREAAEAKSKIVKLVDETNKYNAYLRENYAAATVTRGSGGGEGAALAVASGVEIADQIMGFIKENKKNKQESIKNELDQLKLKALDEYVME